MAINPILAKDAFTQELFPLPIASEIFVLKRTGVAFKIETATGTMKGSGLFFLTNRRLVFLKDGKVEQHKQFTSLEIPLHLVSEPKFEQPIFGANYMKGKVEPLTTAQNPLESSSNWFLTFNRGGCGTFLNIFFDLYKSAKRNYAASTSELTHQLSQGANAAFADPNDPSVLYVCQPTPDNPSETDFGGGYPLLQPPSVTPPVHSNYGGPPVHSNYGGPPVHSNYESPPVHSNYGGPPVHSNYGGPPVHSNYGGPPVHSNYGGPPVHSNYGGPPVHSNYGGPPVHSNYGGPPVHSNYGGPPVHSNYGSSPVHSNYGSPPVHSNYGGPPVHSNYGSPPVHSNYGGPPVHTSGLRPPH